MGGTLLTVTGWGPFRTRGEQARLDAAEERARATWALVHEVTEAAAATQPDQPTAEPAAQKPRQ